MVTVYLLVTQVCSYGDREVLLMFVFLVKLLSGMRRIADLQSALSEAGSDWQLHLLISASRASITVNLYR